MRQVLSMLMFKITLFGHETQMIFLEHERILAEGAHYLKRPEHSIHNLSLSQIMTVGSPLAIPFLEILSTAPER